MKGNPIGGWNALPALRALGLVGEDLPIISATIELGSEQFAEIVLRCPITIEQWISIGQQMSATLPEKDEP